MATEVKKDVDLQLRVRSSTESVSSLEKITSYVLETLSKELQLVLVEKNVNVNRTADKTLVTISLNLEHQD